MSSENSREAQFKLIQAENASLKATIEYLVMKIHRFEVQLSADPNMVKDPATIYDTFGLQCTPEPDKQPKHAVRKHLQVTSRNEANPCMSRMQEQIKWLQTRNSKLEALVEHYAQKNQQLADLLTHKEQQLLVRERNTRGCRTPVTEGNYKSRHDAKPKHKVVSLALASLIQPRSATPHRH